ncbi:MAG: hypothetical protein A3F46_07885 [Legionellales bacterium RIFCSPHIGHO2_12_FULL_42_9]|nr:MAG: hypothetical protein A3F46_07885 [Legionellales bacterium RIFCSPHIGHO2_12_FULL_42_9]
MPGEFTFFDRLPAELKAIVGGKFGNALVSLKDIAALALTSKANYQIFQPILNDAKMVLPLLQHIVRGKQEAACAMLQADTSLFFKKGWVTDNSGRAFYYVSAFQCALWAIDSYMLKMMLNCLQEMATTEEGYAEAENIRLELLKQYDEIQLNGLNYTTRDGEEVRGDHHFNPQSLIDDLRTTVSQFHHWTSAQQKHHWSIVGWDQYKLPAHFAQEYCQPRRQFDPVPLFNELSTCKGSLS